MVQLLTLLASTAGGVGSIPAQRTKIPHATRCGQKIQKQTKEQCMIHSKCSKLAITIDEMKFILKINK